MTTNVVMPKMGESITEGTILVWHKEVGDTIKIGFVASRCHLFNNTKEAFK